MPDFVPGCAARTVGRAPDPLPIPESAIPSGLPATAWHSRTDVAPPRRRPPAAFPGPQNDPPAIANAPAPLRRSRCPVFAGRRVRAPSAQTPAASSKSSSRASLAVLPTSLLPSRCPSFARTKGSYHFSFAMSIGTEAPARSPFGSLLLLTISRRDVFFLLNLRGNAAMADKPRDLVRGNSRHAHFENAGARTHARLWDRRPARTMSKGVFRLNAGSLFVAFQRLERAGLISSEWKATENSRRAKYYVLTDQGRKRLNSKTREWGRQVAAIARILEAS